MKYLIAAVDRDTQDAGYTAEGWATFTPVAAETEVHCGAEVDLTIDGQHTGGALKRVIVNHDDLKGWTLPHTIVLPCQLTSTILGKDETVDGTFTINRKAIGQDTMANHNNRLKQSSFDIDDKPFTIGDDGHDMAVASSMIITYDTIGLGLVSVKPTYDVDGNPITPAYLCPGHHSLVEFREQADEDAWVLSKDALPWIEEPYDARTSDFGPYSLWYKDLGNGLRLYDGARIPDGLITNTQNRDFAQCVPPEEPPVE